MEPYVVVAIACAAYTIAVLAGLWRGSWKRHEISLYGPVMIVRTHIGLKLMGRMAGARRFWAAYGRVSIWAVIVTMAITTLYLAGQAAEAYWGTGTPELQEEREVKLPEGPWAVVLAYVVVGFLVAIVVHEFAHGIQALAARIRLKSTGILLLVIPIGAFVETDDSDLDAAPKYRRLRLYASGPATNLFTAALCLLLIGGVLGPSLEPVSPGAVVVDVAADSPAALFGLPPWSQVFSVEGQPVLDDRDMEVVSFAEPGESVRVSILYKSKELSVALPGGVVLHHVYDGPGYDAGLRAGMIVRNLDDRTINTLSEFRSVTENASRVQPVNITVLRYGIDDEGDMDWFVEETRIKSVNLTSKWLYYRTHFPNANREEYRNISYMAVTATALGVMVRDADYVADRVARPLEGVRSGGGLVDSARRFVALPLIGYSPVVSPASDLYEPAGILGFVPGGLYWPILNVLYWVFWASLMLALANALPALPFDGGYILRDLLRELSHRWGQRFTGLDRAIGRKPLTDARIDEVVWFVSGAVIMAATIIIILELLAPA